MGVKGSQTVRIVFENVNGLGIDSSLEWKNHRFITMAKELEFDIVGRSELHLNWSKAKSHQRLRERLRQCRWDKLEVCAAHNKHENLHFFQPEGTSMLALYQVAFRVSASGADSAGLGRWAWMLLRGKGVNVRFISAYQTCMMRAEEKYTVWVQQQRYLKYVKKEQVTPREAFQHDLTAAI